LILAELDYFLREERSAMRAFMDDLSEGAFTFAPFWNVLIGSPFRWDTCGMIRPVARSTARVR
jgi:hypothetical protein